MFKGYRKACRQILISLSLLEDIASRLLFFTGASDSEIWDQIRDQERCKNERCKLLARLERGFVYPVAVFKVWASGFFHQLWCINKVLVRMSKKGSRELKEYYDRRKEILEEVRKEREERR